MSARQVMIRTMIRQPVQSANDLWCWALRRKSSTVMVVANARFLRRSRGTRAALAGDVIGISALRAPIARARVFLLCHPPRGHAIARPPSMSRAPQALPTRVLLLQLQWLPRTHVPTPDIGRCWPHASPSKTAWHRSEDGRLSVRQAGPKVTMRRDPLLPPRPRVPLQQQRLRSRRLQRQRHAYRRGHTRTRPQRSRQARASLCPRPRSQSGLPSPASRCAAKSQHCWRSTMSHAAAPTHLRKRSCSTCPQRTSRLPSLRGGARAWAPSARMVARAVLSTPSQSTDQARVAAHRLSASGFLSSSVGHSSAQARSRTSRAATAATRSLARERATGAPHLLSLQSCM